MPGRQQHRRCIPPPAAGSAWVGIRGIIHVLALNKGFATNAVPAGAIPASIAAHVAEVKAVADEVAIAAGALSRVAAVKPEAAPAPGIMLVLLAAGLSLSACTAAQVGQAVADGQLVCAVGPTVVALADPSGAAVLAKGSSKAFVDAACALIGAIAVSPPGAPVPTVTIVPPTVTLPLVERLTQR